MTVLNRMAAIFVLFLALGPGLCSAFPDGPADSTTQVIPIGGNAWETSSIAGAAKISDSGLVRWADPEAVCRVMFRFNGPCRANLAFSLSLLHGRSAIRVTAQGKTVVIDCQAVGEHDYPVGEIRVEHEGYVAVDLQGVSRTDSTFGRLAALIVRGVPPSLMSFVRNNEGNFFYWGRRGPSVHLNYSPPADTNVEWFYNEVTIPESQDVMGSFFMAEGFSGGYFGMQVNSPIERRILFSIWSPFATDDPKAIPADQRVELVRKGPGVHAGEFGDEGSGGQSYLIFDWKADSTYRFLLHAEPDSSERTLYTAYFYAPEQSRWMLVASFRRPKTASYLKGLHSFLENFIPETGMVERSGRFGNQWAKGPRSGWHELTQARFSADNTARHAYRMDYAGGSVGRWFYLKNCGFFDTYTRIGEVIHREAGGTPPAVDLSELP